MQSVRSQASRLRTLSDPALRDAAGVLRESLARADAPPATVTQGLALSVEALRRTVGVELYDVQLMAALAISLGNVAEMQTGEGKTFSVAPAAVLSALRGDAVHVATPNAYLAERDFSLLSPMYEVLGISVALLGDTESSLDARRAAYDSEITYATGVDFGFDYLRDQAACQVTTCSAFGHGFAKQLERYCQPGTSLHPTRPADGHHRRDRPCTARRCGLAADFMRRLRGRS